MNNYTITLDLSAEQIQILTASLTMLSMENRAQGHLEDAAKARAVRAKVYAEIEKIRAMAAEAEGEEVGRG